MVLVRTKVSCLPCWLVPLSYNQRQTSGLDVILDLTARSKILEYIIRSVLCGVLETCRSRPLLILAVSVSMLLLKLDGNQSLGGRVNMCAVIVGAA